MGSKKSTAKNKTKLNDRQATFVVEYIDCGNATEAAKRAGYSEKTAYSKGHELLKKTEIQEAIRKHNYKRAVKIDFTKEQILQEIAAVAFSDISDLATWGGDIVNLLDSENLEKKVTKAVQEISSTRGDKSNSVKLKLHDKLKALDLLIEKSGLFNDVGTTRPGHDQATRETFADRIRGAITKLHHGE